MTRARRYQLGFLAVVGSLVVAPAANAIIGVAPGGSVVRRHAIVATTEVAATQSAAAAAPPPPPAASAPPPPPAAPPAAPPPPAAPALAALPAGCVSQTVGTSSYFKCGSTYYQPTFQGTNLVYVAVPAPK